MSSKVAHYLQEHLLGEVMDGTDARAYFATDGSILQVPPALITYPKNENDIRKTARFCWQLAERGRLIPITPRGAGTNYSGSAIGSGIIVVLSAHMNRILELDNKAQSVTVEPGINYGKLQQALLTYDRIIPAYPPSYEYSSVGGAIAENASGEKSVKYGDTRRYVKKLRVVLANGEVITTERLSKRELSKKLGLATFEGEIYRSVDTLIEENRELVASLGRSVPKNNAGYMLNDVLRADGSFDLTTLMVGSQGTLGLITEAELEAVPFSAQSTLLLAQFDSLEQCQRAVIELIEQKERPSAVELVDEQVLTSVSQVNPNHLKDILKPPYPALVLLVEYDNGDKSSKKAAKKAEKILGQYAKDLVITDEPEEQQRLWKIRGAVDYLNSQNDGLLRAVPIVDGGVAVDRLREYIEGLNKIASQNNIKTGIFGRAGEGILHIQPKLNLGQVGDRQKAIRVLEEQTKLVLELGGSISSEDGDGRIRAPYLETMYGAEAYQLLEKVKKIFDPYNILNPGVKFGTDVEGIKSMMRNDFNLSHLYDHLPRS